MSPSRIEAGATTRHIRDLRNSHVVRQFCSHSAQGVADPAMSQAPAGRLLPRMVFGLDAVLRRGASVIEFTREPDCIFRIQIVRLHQDVLLLDGTLARSHERVINLHFWNEHLPLMLNEEPSVGWARRMARSVERSLQALARHLVARPDLDDVVLLRANITFSSPERRDRVTRVCRRFGFEEVADCANMTVVRRLHDLGENILTSLMIKALQASGPREAALRRDRTQLFMSRKWLMHRYGSHVGVVYAKTVGDSCIA